PLGPAAPRRHLGQPRRWPAPPPRSRARQRPPAWLLAQPAAGWTPAPDAEQPTDRRPRAAFGDLAAHRSLARAAASRRRPPHRRSSGSGPSERAPAAGKPLKRSYGHGIAIAMSSLERARRPRKPPKTTRWWLKMAALSFTV